MSFGGDIAGAKFEEAIDDRIYPIDEKMLRSTSVVRRHMVRVLPEAPGSVDRSTAEIRFTMKGDSSQGVDLAGSYFSFRARLQRQDLRDTNAAGANRADTTNADGITPVIGWPSALFGEISIEIGGKKVSDSVANGKLQPYAAFARALLYEGGPTTIGRGYSSGAWEAFILPEPLIGETNADQGVVPAAPTAASFAAGGAYGIADSPNPTAVELRLTALAAANATIAYNPNLLRASVARKKPFVDAGAGWVQICFKPKDGAFRCPMYIPPGVDIVVTFNRSDPGFEVIGTGTAVAAGTSGLTPSIRIDNSSFEWWVPRLQYSSDAAKALSALALSSKLVFPKDHMRVYRSPAFTSQSSVVSQAFSGIIPDLLVVMPIRADALNRAGANIALDPFDTKLVDDMALVGEQNGTAYINVEAGGVVFPLHGGRGMETWAQAYSAYVEACLNCDMHRVTGHQPALTLEQFKKRPIYCFNLRESGVPFYNHGTDDANMGTVNINYNFAGATAATDADKVVFICCALTNAQWAHLPGGAIELEGF